jgi:OPA family sugar phosphate sensor protein UhpC-like MFS transporter
MSTEPPRLLAVRALPPLPGAQQGWRWRILIASYLGYGGYYVTRKAFTICKTTMAKDLNWDLGDTAHIWTAYLVAYMVGMFINSFLGRR